jgi:hypothetical protein
MAFGVVLAGVPTALALLVAMLPSLFLPFGGFSPFWVFSLACAVLAFVAGLFGIGLIAEALWRRGAAGQVLMAIGMVGNLWLGEILVSLFNVQVHPSPATCERQLTDELRVQVLAYSEEGVMGGTRLFFMASTDGGRRWNQAMHFRFDDPIAPPCQNSGQLDGQTAWLWMGWQYAITQDGGRTWDLWELDETWANWKCCDYGPIKDIRFRDNLHGEMTLSPRRGSEAPLLETRDGGLTWREPSE